MGGCRFPLRLPRFLQESCRTLLEDTVHGLLAICINGRENARRLLGAQYVLVSAGDQRQRDEGTLFEVAAARLTRLLRGCVQRRVRYTMMLFRQDIGSQSSKSAPIVIVTNKTDLTTDENCDEHENLISEARQFADAHMCRYTQCTAKDYNSVENVFMTVLREFSPLVVSCSRLKKRRQSMPATTASQNQEALRRRQVGGSVPATPVIKQSQQRCTVS
ncbi:unnamed protein product [Soboliphyme baturini]|uniref:Small monomeric GTPase n=1 Tax=Soboliphyme baturini TaxID=241478 RepID=A0A183IZQ5_9BILA|nr:unnamed protein product [Soboliphyme baturini]